jgi:hypothetical protein
MTKTTEGGKTDVSDVGRLDWDHVIWCSSCSTDLVLSQCLKVCLLSKNEAHTAFMQSHAASRPFPASTLHLMSLVLSQRLKIRLLVRERGTHRFHAESCGITRVPCSCNLLNHLTQAKSGPHLRGLLVIQCFSLDCTVQSALVANLSMMMKTSNLENQSNKTQFQKMQSVIHAGGIVAGELTSENRSADSVRDVVWPDDCCFESLTQCIVTR